MLKEIFRGSSFRRSKRKKSDKEVHWADLGGGELAKLSYISLDDSTLNLSDLESDPPSPSESDPPSPTESDSPSPTESDPPSPTDSDETPSSPRYVSFPRVACAKCPECEKMAGNSSFWEQKRTGTKTSRRRRKRYGSFSGPADSERGETSGPKFRRGSRGSSFIGSAKFKVSAAAVFLKKIRRGPLGMCVTCGPHMTQ